MGLQGIYYLLGATPWWVMATVLYIVTVAVLWPMRWMFEGAAYNVAYSSKYGDVLLIGIIALAQVLMQQKSFELPALAATWWYQPFCMGAAVVVGLVLVFVATPLWRTHLTDNYHNFFVVGLYVYLLLSVAPVLWKEPVVFLAAFAMLCSWGLMVYTDAVTGRLDQRPWLKEHDPATYFLLTDRSY